MSNLDVITNFLKDALIQNVIDSDMADELYNFALWNEESE
jgi:hypothetical protein